ncbi:hypothetical protein IVB69_06030 [Flavobacterium sp. J49]|uniref:hypothetical protein n=1 Tax=Flavobacterium sp. J49 TaxID=2718534 RepID=UPI0015946638|nr:hypothetical protein [Flavobacterium sp. J49]MBF6641032.1 hypothetical protein [Flavobacterium sp. J49]NIC02279.1 hypothetical protein [Flavobacterium sp. J49]
MKNIAKICLLLSLLLTNFAAFAQIDEPPEGGDAQAAPIDTKLILLATMGILFVLYTLRQKKKTV